MAHGDTRLNAGSQGEEAVRPTSRGKKLDEQTTLSLQAGKIFAGTLTNLFLHQILMGVANSHSFR